MTVIPSEQVPRVLLGLKRKIQQWGPRGIFGYLGHGTSRSVRVLDCWMQVKEVGDPVEFCILAETSDGTQTSWVGEIEGMGVRSRENEGCLILSTDLHPPLRLYASDLL